MRTGEAVSLGNLITFLSVGLFHFILKRKCALLLSKAVRLYDSLLNFFPGSSCATEEAMWTAERRSCRLKSPSRRKTLLRAVFSLLKHFAFLWHFSTSVKISERVHYVLHSLCSQQDVVKLVTVFCVKPESLFRTHGLWQIVITTARSLWRCTLTVMQKKFGVSQFPVGTVGLR